jgi:hypothetical protein
MRSGVVGTFCWSLVSVLFVAAADRGADPMRAGPATFTPPEGWSVKSQPDGLVRIVSPDDNATIMVMPAPPFDGDLGEAFDTTWAALKKAIKVQKVVKGGQAETRVNGKGYETIRTEATVLDAAGNRIACRYVMVRNGTGLVGVLYMGTPEAFEEFGGAYGAFSSGFSLGGKADDAGGKLVPAAPQKAAGDDAQPADQTGDDAAAPPAKGKPAPQAPPLEPGTVAGRITDARGNVIEGARLIVQVAGTTLAGARTNFDIEVEENGLFSQEVPDGLWRIYGFVEKEANGHKYRLPLDPEDKREIGSTQGTKKGVVKNFVWKIAGLKPHADKSRPSSYYGAGVELMDSRGYDQGRRLADRHPGAKVVITLTPRGPLLDGSKGKPVNLETDVAAMAAFARPTYPDIPLGAYVATAVAVTPGGARAALNIAPGIARSDAAPSRSAALNFVPASEAETLGTFTLSVWE